MEFPDEECNLNRTTRDILKLNFLEIPYFNGFGGREGKKEILQ